MDKQLFIILKTFEKIKKSLSNDKITNDFYKFFITSYKAYNNIEDLIIAFLIEKELFTNYKNFLQPFLNNIDIDDKYIDSELKRCSYIKNYVSYKETKIIKIANYQKNYKSYINKGEFIIFSNWFNNFFIIKNTHSQKCYKVFFPDEILNKIYINDVISLELVKKDKHFWQIQKIIDFYPKGSNLFNKALYI